MSRQFIKIDKNDERGERTLTDHPANHNGDDARRVMMACHYLCSC